MPQVVIRTLTPGLSPRWFLAHWLSGSVRVTMINRPFDGDGLITVFFECQGSVCAEGDWGAADETNVSRVMMLGPTVDFPAVHGQVLKCAEEGGTFRTRGGGPSARPWHLDSVSCGQAVLSLYSADAI